MARGVHRAGQLGERLQAHAGHAEGHGDVYAQAGFWCIARRRLVESQRGHRVGRSLSRMTLDPHAIRAVVEGEHSDPFAVLGPHRVQTPDGAAVAVRAIVPGAAAVRVLPADAPPTAMERLHPVGFFATVLPDRRDPFAYRLEVTRDGRITEIEDPYRFPSLLSDFDRHLLAEGTHYRAHQKLGAHPAVLGGVTGGAFAVWAR